jgi:hypothetical protein
MKKKRRAPTSRPVPGQAPARATAVTPSPPHGTDLYAYAGLLGESFRARVELLGSVLGNAHHPSVGTFKESLIAELLRNTIPKRFEVASGFVLFAMPGQTPVAGPVSDPMRYHSFVLSHQCDVIVYDAANVPVVFRDLNFAIVRPEAVRAVIEIKGRLTPQELRRIIDNAIDFGDKWSRWADAHVASSLGRIPQPPAPMLGALAWKASGRPGNPNPDGLRARKSIAGRFSPLFTGGRFTRPVLDQLLVYDEYVVSSSVDVFDIGQELKAMFGWQTAHGRWLKRKDDGGLVRREDKTIASLLAAVLAHVESPDLSGLPTGRYVGTPWRARDEEVLPHPSRGATYCGEWRPPGQPARASAPRATPSSRARAGRPRRGRRAEEQG